MLVALESISTRDALWADMTPRERRLPHRAVERPNPMRPTKPGQRRQRYSASPAGSAVTGRAPGAPSIRSRPMSPTRSPISSRRCFSAASTLASEEGDRTERELSDRGHCRPSPRGSGRARSAQQLGVGFVYEVEALSVIGAYRLRHHEPTKSSLS
jgi:hypothetical protein